LSTDFIRNVYPREGVNGQGRGIMKSDVFITDGHWRKSLAAVRSLGREGIKVTVGESTRLATAFFSKFCHRAVVYPSPLLNPSEFVDFLYRQVSRNSFRMLLPMEDETLALISKYHSDFSRWTYLPFVHYEKLHVAQNKERVLRLAERLGIPMPRTWYINDISRLDTLKESLPYPVVIKPKMSSGAVGIAYPQRAEEFMAQYLSIHKRFPYPIVQECIPREGPGYGASFLLDEKGLIKASFVHKRLREYPVTGGASTLRESVKRDDIREIGLMLLNALDWFGAAMVEFKVDPRDGKPKLMEINPRFWGSLSLAIESGVNFPYLMYRMSKGEDISPVEDYRTGKRCRWLLPGDLLHFIYNPERMNLSPPFFRFRDKNTAYDILSLSDPLPAIARILTPITFLYDPDMKKRLKKRR